MGIFRKESNMLGGLERGKNWVHQEGGLGVYCEAPAFPAAACVLVDKKQMLTSTPKCSNPLHFTFIPFISWSPRTHAP